ncbi:SDR family NAD(P)-dependent oxidoreductase [Actinomadura flavalba]|uniref:SDR family NAD(P)-dependent oxidoreductase n=1 Tax=Actinomadura flavalba TaxID=1120938 RepID=UPI0003615D79|nr:SDR family oxidoreductase [Actinomadura flavalba]
MNDTMTRDEVFGGLDGRVVLVTGAASGIGAASARLFRAMGATVVGADLTPGDGILPADVSDPEQVAELVEIVVARHGRLDVVHGNAGVNVPGRPHSITDDDYRTVMGVCCDANFYLVRSAVPHMRRDGGVFVFTSSMCGVAATPRSPVYNMAKHALVGLARSVAVDYGAQGIRAVALVTGPTHTGMVDELWPPGPLRDSLIASTAVGRLGTPEEIARAAVFAALPGSSFLTGACLTVDGGATAGWNEMARSMLTLKAAT